MDRTPLNWELYRSFLAVIREGSLSGAARALGLTQPTIGRHIDALEDGLRAPLFTRSQGGLAPTEGALQLVPHAEAMASAAQALERAASGEAEEEKGTVRITASEVVGTEILPAMLTRFRRLYPYITVELVLSNRNEDLIKHEADIAVRMARPTQSALLARKAGTLGLGFHAHRDYIAEFGMPETIEDVLTHPLIGFDRRASIRELKAIPVPFDRTLFSFRCDNDAVQFAALRAGFGIGVCQKALAKKYAELQPVLPGLTLFELEAWIVMHEDLKTSRRMRLMFDHLAKEMQAYARG